MPRRLGAKNKSPIACDGCIDAIRPSCLKRGRSAGLTICECSMRQRGSFTLRSAGGTAFIAAAYMSSVMRLARSPIACVST